MASLQLLAKRVASKGRKGDTTLLHVSKAELAQLEASGKITKNPKTGLPEAWGLGGIGSIISKGLGSIGDFARETTGFFTGGTSGANIAMGKAPTPTTLAVDLAGLGAGATAAGALGAGAAGSAGAAGASGAGGGLGALGPLAQAATILSGGVSVVSAMNTRKALKAAGADTGATPTVEKPTPMPTFGGADTQTVLRNTLVEQARRRGRLSTFLTSPAETLGT